MHARMEIGVVVNIFIHAELTRLEGRLQPADNLILFQRIENRTADSHLFWPFLQHAFRLLIQPAIRLFLPQYLLYAQHGQ